MLETDPILAAAIARAHAPCARLLALWPDGTVRQAWEGGSAILEAGSVTAARDQYVRRSADLVVANPDGALSPQRPGDLFFGGSLLRAERGAIVAGASLYAPIATLVVTGFRAPMAGHLAVSARDPFHLVDAPMGEVVTILDGTPIEEATRRLLAPVLDPEGGGAAWPLDGSSRATVRRAILEDENRLAVTVELAAALGLQLYADRYGRPVLAPIPTPGEPVAVVQEYSPGALSTLLDLERSGDRVPYNRVVVVFDPPDRDPGRVVVDVDDPSSPIHADRIGIRVAPVHRSSEIPDAAAARAVGRGMLDEYAMLSDAVRGRAIPDVRLDENDVVRFEETVSGTNDRYRLDSLTIPLVDSGGQGMALSGSRVIATTVAA